MPQRRFPLRMNRLQRWAGLATCIAVLFVYLGTCRGHIGFERYTRTGSESLLLSEGCLVFERFGKPSRAEPWTFEHGRHQWLQTWRYALLPAIIHDPPNTAVRGRRLILRLPVWLLLPLAAPITILAHRRRRRRGTLNACPSCDYNLSGLPPHSACPECASARHAP
jgi:hypothetical protein